MGSFAQSNGAGNVGLKFLEMNQRKGASDRGVPHVVGGQAGDGRDPAKSRQGSRVSPAVLPSCFRCAPTGNQAGRVLLTDGSTWPFRCCDVPFEYGTTNRWCRESSTSHG